VCENAALFWSDVGALHRAARGSYLANQLTREAHELFYDLLHLAVPTTFFEEQTGTSFRARVRDLNHEEFRVQGELREIHIPKVHFELRDLHAALGERSPKTEALLRVLREQVDKLRTVMLVARNANLARIYRAYLASIAGFHDIRVTSLSEVGEEFPADVAILTGLAPAWARHIYSSGIATEILVLSYSADAGLVVSDPFVETEYVGRAVAYQRKYAAWLARPAQKARCWKALSDEDLGIADDEPLPPKVDPKQIDVVQLPQPPDVPPGLWEIDMSWLERGEGERDSHAGTASVDRNVPVEGIRLTFEDGRWVILDRDGTVTRFKFQQADPGVEVAQLKPGDEVVFLDGNAQKDMLAKVLEVAKEIPQLATAATWVEYWRDALRRAKQRFKTYEFLADRLRARGCQRESQTIRLWVIGKTIGPSDPADVRRVGAAIDDAPLRDHHDVVYAGIEAFRGAHAQLMQRIGALALRVGPGASLGSIDADQVIDERSGLTAADFQGSVEILRIRSIAPQGLVPLSVVGRLHEDRDTGAGI